MSNTYNALIHAKQDGTGEEVANNKTGGDGSLYAPVTSIATPENGDTASKAYAVGEMFIRGGKLCTCIVAISSGDALVKDTNYKEGDVGSVLTELRKNVLDASSAVDITPYTSISNIYVTNRDGIVVAKIGQGASNHVAVSFKDGITFLDVYGNANNNTNYSASVRKGQGLMVTYNIGNNNAVKFIPFAD